MIENIVSLLLQLLRKVLACVIIVPTLFPQMCRTAFTARRDFALFGRPVCKEKLLVNGLQSA